MFDSVSGNTEQIANAVAGIIGEGTKAVRTNSREAKNLEKLLLRVVGSPTYGGKPTDAMQKYLDGLPALPKGLKVATFETRLKMPFVRLFGFAAEKNENPH